VNAMVMGCSGTEANEGQFGHFTKPWGCRSKMGGTQKTM